MYDSIALACILTDNFRQGALVMLHSFLRHNPWFKGDVLIFHNQLEDDTTKQLQRLIPNVIFKPISTELRSAVESVVGRRPDLNKRQSSFYKGDIFRLKGYEKVIYFDCDMLVRGNLQELCTLDGQILAAGDGAYFRGEKRSSIDYALSKTSHEPTLKTSFCAGLMVLDEDILTSQNFECYLEMMSRFTETAFRSGHTDQAILNILFDGKIDLLEVEFNYYLKHKADILEATGRSFEDSIVLHFGGWKKPWVPLTSVMAMQLDPQFEAANAMWRSAYRDYILDTRS